MHNTKTKIKLRAGEIYPLTPSDFGMKLNIGEVNVCHLSRRGRVDYELTHTIYNTFSSPHISESKANFTAFGNFRLYNQNAVCLN